MTQAYPLHWPEGWPRTPACNKQDSKYRFRKGRYDNRSPFWTFAEARDAMIAELERLGARNSILSSNYELRLDGLPRGGQSTPADTGIAVYFTLKKKPMVMACDLHMRAEENMRSIALAIDAMRALERHGGGAMMEKAFGGFAALPSPTNTENRAWWNVLDLSRSASVSEIETAFRALAKERHPDTGGSAEDFTVLSRAREQALMEARQNPRQASA